MVVLLFAGLWIPRMQMLHDLHEPGCALISDDEPVVVGVGNLIAYLPTPEQGTPTPEGDRTPVWPVSEFGEGCKVCASGECSSRPPSGVVYAMLTGEAVTVDDVGILTGVPTRTGDWRWRDALDMPAGLNRVWGGLRVIYGICILAFGFGIVASFLWARKLGD